MSDEHDGGVMWYLALRGPRAGEVWCDARASDGKVRRVAGSFSEWYRGWLDAAVEDRCPWTAWDWKCCATADVLSQFLHKLDEEQPEKSPGPGRLAGKVNKLKLLSAGGHCFSAGAPLDPCEGCVNMAAYQGLEEDAFPPGVAPFEGREEKPVLEAPPRARRVLGWLRRFRGG